MITVVIMEIHIGVIVSPAPRITPDKVWVMDIAIYPPAKIHMK